MSDMPNPILPWQVGTGGTYWAARGDTQWSAVRILAVMRKKAHVERVVPRTGEIIHRKGKVKLDELVKRDPKLKGKDKPKHPPAEVFKRVREVRAEEKREKGAKAPEPVQESIPEEKTAPSERTPEEEARRQAAIQKLFDMLPDDGFDDDW